MALILAAIFVYIGVNLLPGLNTTISSITTAAGYDAGVVGMVGVIMIVFAAIRYNCGFREQSLSNNRPNSGKAKSKDMLTAELNPELNWTMRREHRGGILQRIMRCSDTLVKTGDNRFGLYLV